MKNLIKPYRNDPFVGHLSTPITASALTRTILSNLPVYRKGLTSTLRGLEIGATHGYFMVGPFAYLGPLRNSGLALEAGYVSAFGLICILGIMLEAYGRVTYSVPDPESSLDTKQSWKEFQAGVIGGSLGGASLALFLLQTVA